MSTYYKFQCSECKKTGGFFSRQAWGWGNADIVKNHKFIMNNKEYFCHETAVIDEGCEIGKGTKIWHFSHILPSCVIGENCNIGQNVFIGKDVKIGNNCKIQNNVSLYTGLEAEDNVFFV